MNYQSGAFKSAKIRKKRNLNLASRTLKFSQIKPERTDPLLHYSSESLSIHLTPWRKSNSCAWSLTSLYPAGSRTPRRSSWFWWRWSASASEKLRGSIQGPAQTRGAAQLGRRRARLAWPRAQAFAAATAPVATRYGGEGRPGRGARG